MVEAPSDVLLNCLAHCSLSDFDSIALTSRTFLSIIKDEALFKLRREKGIVEHLIFFSGRLSEWEAYDPNSNRWRLLPEIPFKGCFSPEKNSLAVGTEVLVFGKEVMPPVIYKYSILTNAWTSGKGMNTPRSLFGSASLGEVAVIAGGCDTRGNILNSAEIFNSESGEWTVITSMMNKARKMCSSVFMDGNFYVIGGRGEGKTMLTCGEVYDMKKKTWTLIPNMVQHGGGDQALVAVVKDELYAANYAQKEVRKYDKLHNVWYKVGNLPGRASRMSGGGMAFRACGDKLVVVVGTMGLKGEGFIEISACVPREGEELHWRVLGSKKPGNFVYNCAVMGC